MILFDVWGMVDTPTWIVCFVLLSIAATCYIFAFRALIAACPKPKSKYDFWEEARREAGDPHPDRPGPIHQYFDDELDDWIDIVEEAAT